MKSILFLLFLSSTSAFAASDTCNYFTYCDTGTSSKSNSSSTRSASFNPSNVARIKGLGVETLLQANNNPGFSLVTGTGRVGGALVSSSTENGFFGNRSLELDGVFLKRYQEKKRYDNKKISFALGAGIVNSKNFEVNLGLSLKRHKEIKKINTGLGLSAKYKNFSIGSYIYKDDVKIDLVDEYSPFYTAYLQQKYASTTYQENFVVKAFTLGITAGNFLFDIGHLRTNYDFYGVSSTVTIYSLAYNWNKLFLSLGYRNEHTPNAFIDQNEMLVPQRKKDFMYYGVQFLVFKYLKLGVGYNTFLMHEVSGTVTLFIN